MKMARHVCFYYSTGDYHQTAEGSDKMPIFHQLHACLDKRSQTILEWLKHFLPYTPPLPVQTRCFRLHSNSANQGQSLK